MIQHEAEKHEDKVVQEGSIKSSEPGSTEVKTNDSGDNKSPTKSPISEKTIKDLKDETK